MDEADLLIKELRIDNETLLSTEYNPLPQVFQNKKSNSNYRNIYHRVEKIMESIINITYKGFSDSVLSYMEVYNLNLKNVTLLSEIKSRIDEITRTTFDIENIRNIFSTTEYLKIKCDITESLKDLNDTLEEYYNCTDLTEKCYKILKAKRIIKDNNLIKIEGIELLRNDILLEIEKFMIKVYSKLQEYIFRDEIQYKELLRIVNVMNKFDDFDRYLNKNYTKYLVLDNITDTNYIDNIKSINTYFNKILTIYFKLNKNKDKKDIEYDNTILLLEDYKFIKIDYITNTLVFYKYIKDNTNFNALYNRIRDIYNTNKVNYYLVNTLLLINKKYKIDKYKKLTDKYIKKLSNDLEDEVLYLFDIFYRENNFTNDFYINKIIKVIKQNMDLIDLRKDILSKIIKKINKYIKNNISGSISEDFIVKVKLLDEILGEYTDECIEI
ncbi:hypothetical protein AAJ76_400005849 [Vairimorpha ceranae]|uniref:Uncharacterized protein n=1 Tax=Vairimorpha ceranae TaxID=40302 RepID=A0A0F9YQP4_9MICR|nr:hypothetical protein AAJ76_400005849 [Vairimorpha ceranae]KAF5141802.1 hypothetical protein G9O61_00g000850 [Vairimorpha ceranae]KKO74882.1 hypothetical protein AAJ76_400005849 [Vairimorpha ceranae]